MASREKDFEMGRVKNAVLGRLGCGCRVNIENRQGRYLIDFQTRMLIRRAVYSALKYEHMLSLIHICFLSEFVHVSKHRKFGRTRQWFSAI